MKMGRERELFDMDVHLSGCKHSGYKLVAIRCVVVLEMRQAMGKWKRREGKTKRE
jgi:hypothetical protein